MKGALMILATMLVAGCCGKKEATEGKATKGPAAGGSQLSTATGAGAAASAHVLVYRTKTDHKEQVPVLLSADRRTIVSYPHPKDLWAEDGLSVPIELTDGWLMDRRGIGTNVAFLRMTYPEYAAMENTPSLAELDTAIMDRDPLKDLCDCGPRAAFKDPAAQLNSIIRHDSLYIRCKRLK